MNNDAIRAHERLISRDDLTKRTHECVVSEVVQGKRISPALKNRVRQMLRVKSLSEVARATGLHTKTVARIRDETT